MGMPHLKITTHIYLVLFILEVSQFFRCLYRCARKCALLILCMYETVNISLPNNILIEEQMKVLCLHWSEMYLLYSFVVSISVELQRVYTKYIS
jgi:hypothetical protein